MFAATAQAVDDPNGYSSAGNQAETTTSDNLLIEAPYGGIWQNSGMLGDMGGVRTWLGNYGVSLGVQETSELLGNATGGVRRGIDYDGLTTVALQVDTQRALDWKGGLFTVSGLQVHGDNLSAKDLKTLQTASGIEADRATRLWELWYQQAFWYNQADVKIGQQSLDQEFMVSQYALSFVNTMFGWPMIPSVDMLSGGPAYPLSSPGARLRLQPEGPFVLLAGVYDDNPSGMQPGSDKDPQQLNHNGINFRVNDAPLFIAELQYGQPAIGDLDYGKEDVLPRAYKLGFWYDAGKFGSQEYANDNFTLADPAGSGNPQLKRGNYSIYAVVDQMLWRENPQSEQALGFFLRAMGAPPDRNLVDFSLNAGFVLHEPIEHRDNDVLGLGLGYAHVSSSASAFDRESNGFNSTQAPVRSDETFVELTYQYQIVSWWQVQPDVQYVFNPGGGVEKNNGTGRIGNEVVLGLRTNIIF